MYNSVFHRILDNVMNASLVNDAVAIDSSLPKMPHAIAVESSYCVDITWCVLEFAMHNKRG
jgi:hypothetical protein